MAEAGWITKYGLPSIIASMAVFALQQQQQVFDRLQHTIEDGYQFYSSARKPLLTSDDADREVSLLRIVGNAFPNIYCDVREDMFQRTSAISPPVSPTPGADGAEPIDYTDLQQLRQQLIAADRPARKEFPENLAQAWTQFGSRGPGRQCPALNQPEVAGADTDAKTPPVAKVAAPSANTPPAIPAAASASGDQPPRLTPAPHLMRVFFHIVAGGNRDASLSEQPRAELAPYNYRVMRGVERIPSASFPSQPEIRYFGADQAAAARELSIYLEWAFRSERLHFVLRAIGAQFPSMPRENVEVWLPNSAPS